MCWILTRRLSACIVFLMLPAVCMAQKEWFLLDHGGDWRSFSTEAAWRKTGKEIQPLEFATVNRTPKNILVDYEYYAESGDWQYSDRYTFGLDGRLLALKRTFVSSSQQIKRVDAYDLNESGEIKRVSTHEVSLETGKETSEVPEAPDLPIATKFGNLSFIKQRRKTRSLEH